jgi:hypothetical protein
METTMKAKLVPFSLAIAVFGGIGSYAAAGQPPPKPCNLGINLPPFITPC